MLLEELRTLEEGDIVEINGYSFEVFVADGSFTYANDTEDPDHEICISFDEHDTVKIDERTP